MENAVTLVGNQMKWFLPLEMFWKKDIPALQRNSDSLLIFTGSFEISLYHLLWHASTMLLDEECLFFQKMYKHTSFNKAG